ncbi:MAG: hypothetical protein PF442_01330 [Desulfobulbaceae bacterium]|nr:hypothetical protein [Desulfobulbaceae bacterium]
MGLDTECDLALEAGGQQRLKTAIAAFRNRLLAEHLDVSPPPRLMRPWPKSNLLSGLLNLCTARAGHSIPCLFASQKKWMTWCPLVASKG